MFAMCAVITGRREPLCHAGALSRSLSLLV